MDLKREGSPDETINEDAAHAVPLATTAAGGEAAAGGESTPLWWEYVGETERRRLEHESTARLRRKRERRDVEESSRERISTGLLGPAVFTLF